MHVLVPTMVDLLPERCWKPRNLWWVGSHSIYFSIEDRVRAVEWDGRVVAKGRTPVRIR